MSTDPEDQVIEADELDIKRVQHLAAIIADNRQLRRIIRKVQPHMRQAVYDAIVPYLSFKPKPYTLLKS